MRIAILITSLACLVALGAFMVAVDRLERALERPSSGELVQQVIVVPEQPEFKQVVGQLVDTKLVRDDGWLSLYAEDLRAPSTLIPGEYSLSSEMSLLLQVSQMEQGNVMTHTVGIDPGDTAEDVVAVLVKQGLGDAQALTATLEDPELLARFGPGLSSLEGFLLPDIYTVPKGLSAKTLIEVLLKRFEDFSAPLKVEQKRPLFDVVRVASLIQTAQVPEREKRVYSAMLYNRLDKGVPLDHPTSEAYGTRLGLTRPKNPYRTDRKPGLPPTPICNPGPDALRAAFQPVKTDALFKVRREDGSHYYCPDRECVRAAERSRRGLPPASLPALEPVPRAPPPPTLPRVEPVVVPGRPLTPEPPSETEPFNPEQPL